MEAPHEYRRENRSAAIAGELVRLKEHVDQTDHKMAEYWDCLLFLSSQVIHIMQERAYIQKIQEAEQIARRSDRWRSGEQEASREESNSEVLMMKPRWR